MHSSVVHSSEFMNSLIVIFAIQKSKSHFNPPIATYLFLYSLLRLMKAFRQQGMRSSLLLATCGIPKQPPPSIGIRKKVTGGYVRTRGGGGVYG